MCGTSKVIRVNLNVLSLILALMDAAMNVYATMVPMATMMLNLVHGK